MHKPEDFTLDINDTSEKAFQRAIWMRVTSKIDNAIVTWLDIELPIDIGGREDSQRIDLVGIGNDGAFRLCELKFGVPGHGSPEDAARQLLEYKSAIMKNAGCLGHHKKSEERGTVDWAKVASPSTRLIVAANKDYWDYWRGRTDVSLPTNVECYELPIDNSYFKNQKPEHSSYTPSISDIQNTWMPVVIF